ncbi:MAG: hypothetical protein AAGJ46_18955 [Planctomycetota bacterium]
MNHGKPGRRSTLWVAAAMLLGCAGLTGCTVDIAGQTHPSPFYLSDDLFYAAPGPEFKLAREAAALKAQAEAVGGSGPQECCP